MLRDEITLREFNTTITLRGADGRRKKLWQENRLGRALREAGHEIKIPFVTGHATYEMRSHNLITNAGHAGCAGRLGGVGGYSNAFAYLAVGTGTTAAAVTDTALQTEITTGGLARAAATAAQATTNVTNDTLQLTYTWSASSSFSVTEEGILDASSSGHLLAHQVFSAVNVSAGDSLAVTHSVTC